MNFLIHTLTNTKDTHGGLSEKYLTIGGIANIIFQSNLFDRKT